MASALIACDPEPTPCYGNAGANSYVNPHSDSHA